MALSWAAQAAGSDGLGARVVFCWVILLLGLYDFMYLV